ncbi:aminoglycoside N(3)-acetyltransferase [Kitasatospora sp. NPDC058965]|uniref:aminoglycoside N(3)-acetyltransferase n=1 Tax=Kitasatospora sp. NPDC058965 TaxID=3346682 RepID=UPI00367DA1A0
MTGAPTGGLTGDQLVEQLRMLGVGPDTGVLLVHAALRALGPVAGGSAAVLAALRTALGPGGTLVAYTATPENSATSRLHREATAHLSAEQRAAHLAAMPPFDPAATPCSPTVGRLSEELRRTPGARRSAHPQTSFAALGPLAGRLLADHPYHCHLGERSPLGALYRAGASVLLLGAPLTSCTAFHLAEYRVPGRPQKRYGAVVRGRGWVGFDGVDLDDGHFPAMLVDVLPELKAVTGPVGGGTALLMPLRPAVDAATEWLAGHPAAAVAGGEMRPNP